VGAGAVKPGDSHLAVTDPKGKRMSDKVEIHVDDTLCVGSQSCVARAGHLFTFVDGVAVPRVPQASSSDENLHDAIEHCPVHAITTLPAATDSAATAAEDLSLYRTMVMIRGFEERVNQLMSTGQIPGFVHLSTGQEAIAAGACAVLTDADTITSTHRGHGHCIAKGGTVDRMMAEMFGKPEGYCRGRSGSMHIADPEVGILGANAIVGGGIPMSVGSALAAQIQGEGRVAVVFFGEGAVANGVFHEALNLTALWKLPMIFVCENNQYVELSHVSEHLSASHVADFGEAYGIPSHTGDGNDVLHVRATVAAAVARARRGEGPSLLEFQTYRWHGHFVGDPQAYRSTEEVDGWKQRDPIPRFATVLKERHGVTDTEFATIQGEIDDELDAAVSWAAALEAPPEAIMTEDVYQPQAGAGQ